MTLETIRKNLEAKGYTVSCFATAKEAADYLDGQIDGTTVGFGGSVTLQEMGLYEKLSVHNQVYWHWIPVAGKTAPEVRDEAAKTEVYLSSVNGIAESGEIINIDGTCNRVASIFYGHKKVYLVAGSNKIGKDYEEAFDRAKNVAAPLNAKRLKTNTPCAVKGDRCYHCHSKDRICRGLSVLWEKPGSCPMEVVLIEEPLGY